MNELKKYSSQVVEEINKRNPSIQAVVREVQKNNDTTKVGIEIPGETNVSPVFYLGESDMEHPVEETADRIMEHAKKHSVPVFDAASFKWENVSGKICYKLVNREKNKQLLKNCPYHTLDDLGFKELVAIYTVILDKEYGDSIASVIVKNNHVSYWGVDEEALWAKACENTPTILPIKRSVFQPFPEDVMGLNILTNESMLYGAGAILYPGVVDEILEELGAFYVLPSWIHELIILPTAKEMRRDDAMLQMVNDVNSTAVGEDDILGYDVYYYDGTFECIRSDRYNDSSETMDSMVQTA